MGCLLPFELTHETALSAKKKGRPIADQQTDEQTILSHGARFGFFGAAVPAVIAGEIPASQAD